MNKTISINLGGRNFFIEEVAFQKLESYLSGIRQHFEGFSGSAEIVSDMESRIAEKFVEKHGGNSQAVITIDDVDALIKELGTVEDIANEAEGQKEKFTGKSFGKKRLMRDSDDKIIAGVCAGLAAYFDVDVFIVRLIFGILIFAWGAIVPIYIVLWLIMPVAKTPTEKMQMRGEPLNLGTISETIKERAEELKENVKGVANKRGWKISSFFRGIGKVIWVVIKIILKVIALGLIIALGAAIVSSTVAIAFALFNSTSPYLGLPVSAVTHNLPFYVLLVAGYLIAFVPLMFLLLLSISLLTLRRSVKAGAGLSLLGIWFVALIVAASLGGRYVPLYINEIKNSPELQTVSKTYDVKDFSKLNLNGNITYHLTQGDNFSVTASGWAMDINRLETSVNNGTLTVSRFSASNLCVFCFTGHPTVEITAPDFTAIAAKNSSVIESSGIITTSTSLSLANSSQADIKFMVADLNLSLSNSSLANLSGTANILTGKLGNSSDLRASNLMVTNADINTTNSSSAKVNVRGILKYNISNSSDIYFLGNPQIVNAGSEDQAPLPQKP